MRTRLKELRAREGYNQTELAKKVGVSRQTVSLIERQEFMPSILTAIKIARVFNTNVEDIFIFEDHEFKA
ncbi:transcriptional regulator [Staphylococcus chromogenes]|nr:transcriptional regulator [Staphylococcus chromogenes]